MDKDELIVKIGQMLDEKLDKRLQIMSDEFDAKIEDLRKDMLDQFFLFEQEYGEKIIAMGDYILLDKEKNEIRNKRVDQLENRVERCEANIFACQNDIFKLQQKVK